MSVADVPVDVCSVTPEHARQLVEVALTAVQHSHTLRVPKTEQQRQNGFAAWITELRCNMEPLIYAAVRQVWPERYAACSEQGLAALVERHVRPDMEAFLQSYALRYQAGLWGRRHFGDATIYGVPVREGNMWIVPLSVARYSSNLGRIVMDADGNVIEEQTSTRSQLLKKIRDSQLLPRVENPRLSGVPPSVLPDANASNPKRVTSVGRLAAGYLDGCFQHSERCVR